MTEFGGLLCETTLPLRWSRIEGEEFTYSVAEEQANLNRLQLILRLDEFHQSHRESQEEYHGIAQEIQRLDLKINTILELVGHLVAQDVYSLPQCPVKLAPHLIQWQAVGKSPMQGERVRAELYLDMRFPFPLYILGIIESVDEGDNGYSAKMSLLQPPEAVQEQFEKYIFRCHRRQIARMRTN